jgi:outer membrane protein OmpA-like peptidoglycan-associated protein
MRRLMAIWCSLAVLCPALSATAAEPTPEEIVCALNPKCAKPATRSSRGVTVTGGTENPNTIDLHVNFAYNSADLTSDARITLDNLGTALRDQRLDGYSFTIAGHTDAKGSAQYNQGLSERRAAAVRQYLIERFAVAARRLIAVGYGKSQLLDPSRPDDGVNRRVQIINATASSSRQ